MQPIKRNQNLVNLSKDHHFGLLFIWKIRQGITKNVPVEIIKDYIVYFWNKALAKHFEEEEQLLLSELDADDVFRLRTEKEHKEIKELVRLVSVMETPSNETYQKLCDSVNDHIRFEEREFFPYFERKKSDKLEEIGRKINESAEEFKDDFQPAFWEKGFSVSQFAIRSSQT